MHEKKPEPEPKRDYKYLDIEKLREQELEPVADPVDVVLENALLDIVQLAEDNQMSDEEIDRVLRKIMDDRAAKVRRRFTLHINPEHESD